MARAGVPAGDGKGWFGLGGARWEEGMQATLIVSLMVALVVALFAIQNAAPVTVRLAFWRAETSLVVVILISAALGAMASALASLPGVFKLRRELRGLRAKQSPEPQVPGPSALSD